MVIKYNNLNFRHTALETLIFSVLCLILRGRPFQNMIECIIYKLNNNNNNNKIELNVYNFVCSSVYSSSR